MNNTPRQPKIDAARMKLASYQLEFDPRGRRAEKFKRDIGYVMPLLDKADDDVEIDEPFDFWEQ
jgi:hypothetical protein